MESSLNANVVWKRIRIIKVINKQTATTRNTTSLFCIIITGNNKKEQWQLIVIHAVILFVDCRYF
jgi:hypothetical protein